MPAEAGRRSKMGWTLRRWTLQGGRRESAESFREAHCAAGPEALRMGADHQDVAGLSSSDL